jgi:hypothetical protein
VLAATFILVLVLRPRGLTGGRELTWPLDWRLRRRRRAVAPSRAAEQPAGSTK